MPNSSQSFDVTSEGGSDAELARNVRQILLAAHVESFRQIDVEVIHGTVRLAGAVTSFHAKQLAQEVVLQLVGNRQIENLLHVDARAVSGGPATPDDGMTSKKRPSP